MCNAAENARTHVYTDGRTDGHTHTRSYAHTHVQTTCKLEVRR